MSFEYDRYLKEHIQNTGKALRWMSDNIPEAIDQQAMSIAMENAMRHDDSKNSVDEYAPYDRYFYGGNRSYQVMKDFDRAWLHHIHNNPHHWQYWVLLEDDPKTGERFKALEMPKEYVYEMIADWWTFSWKQNKLDEIFSWYEDHEDKMILNSNTRKLVTDILNAIHIKLEELGKIEGEGVVGEVVEHSGVKGQKWGVRNGPPYPLGDKEKLDSIKNLNALMNSGWNYDVLDHGKHLLDTEDYDWDNNYRTTPINILEKEKIGTCWDFVNYQHDKLKNMGIKDNSYLITIQKSERPDDIVTHTFTTFELGNKKYWLESAAWPKRGVHEINGIEDVAKELNEMYHSPGLGLSIFEYNPEGMDKGLTSNEFFDRASQNLVYDEEPIRHSDEEGDEDLYGVPELKKFPMPDKKHVKSAIRFFNYVDPKHEKELAEAILEKAEEFGLDLENDISVGDENRFKKYLPKEESEK